MASVNYKRLFEVQLLHEYYLTNAEETTIFHDMSKKDIFLQKMLNENVPSVSNGISYEVPDAVKQIFENYRLKLVPGYAGFAAMAQVTEKILPDGTTVYMPRSPIPAEIGIIIQLKLKKFRLPAITNTRINKNISTTFYFTNQDLGSPKTFPVLSAPIAAFDTNYAYEQGELYAAIDGKICQYYVNDANPDFLVVPGDGYANTADELVVPLRFNYRFNDPDNVMKSKFELTDHSGKVVRSWSFTYKQPGKNQILDVGSSQRPRLDSSEEKIAALPLSTTIPANIYTLKVTINDTKDATYRLIFFDENQSLQDSWAVVVIKAFVDNPAFSLYEDDGYLKYRKMTDGTITHPPVFELRVKSRISFWRYINDRHSKLKLDNNSPFLQRSGIKNLVSKLPRTASALPKMFTVKDNNGVILQKKFLPNPDSDERIMIEQGKMYSDIVIPVSDIFPLENTS
jgi:hypothetical protein